MKITQEVREYAAKKGVAEDQAMSEGMEEKSKEFMAGGGEMYIPIKAVP